MGPKQRQPDSFIRLVEAAEEAYTYVTLERLRRLGRRGGDPSGVSASIAQHVRQGLAEGWLLSDGRTRVARGGAFRPVQIYRLDRRHKRVAGVLQG
jgi:hypothetical protein